MWSLALWACSPPVPDTDTSDTDTAVDTDTSDTDTADTDPGPALDEVCAMAPSVADLTVVTAGDTTEATHATVGSCTGGGNESVYVVTAGEVGQTGVLTITLAADSADFGLYLRSDCDDSATEVACSDFGYYGEGEGLASAVQGGVPYALFVDGYDERFAGAFTFTGEFVPDVCGDDVQTGLEGCDDGQTLPQDDDGCSSTCAVEYDWLCDNATVATELQSGDTSGAPSAAFQGSCTLPENTAHEDLYTWTAPTTGTVRVVLDNVAVAADLAVYVRTTCDDATSEIACADDARTGGREQIDVPVVQGVAYTIMVDGMLSTFDDGAYDLVIAYP